MFSGVGLNLNHFSEVQMASCAQMGGHLLEGAKDFLIFVRIFFLSWICFETHLFLVEFIFYLLAYIRIGKNCFF